MDPMTFGEGFTAPDLTIHNKDENRGKAGDLRRAPEDHNLHDGGEI